MLFDIGGRVELYLCRLFCIITEKFNPDLLRWILTIATARTVLEENITRRQKKPEHVAAHCNCELAGWYFREWEKANSKLTIAGEKGIDIISLCWSQYGKFRIL
jgi:hypothetical protein